MYGGERNAEEDDRSLGVPGQAEGAGPPFSAIAGRCGVDAYPPPSVWVGHVPLRAELGRKT
eukprot:7222749-Pyramimonas_sp.AAC.1